MGNLMPIRQCRSATVRSITLLVVLAGQSLAFAGPNMDEQSLLKLQREFPGVQAARLSPQALQRNAADPGLITAVYGVPMSGGATSAQAANNWLTTYAPALGVDQPDLRLERFGEISDGRFDVFVYNQFIDGLPVEYGSVRVLVRKPGQEARGRDGAMNRVVFVGSKMTAPSAEGFWPDVIDAEAALKIAFQTNGYADLAKWSQPQQVVYYGEGDNVVGDGQTIEPVRAWKVLGTNGVVGNERSFTFFIDCGTGRVVHVRNEVIHGVSGVVTGRATPGTLPDNAGNPPAAVAVPMQGVLITISGSLAATLSTSITGAYTSVPFAGAATVTASLAGLTKFPIVNNGGTTLSLSSSVTAPNTVNFTFNSAPAEFNTAQVNALVHVWKTYNFYKALAPTLTTLDRLLTINVNVNQNCNANYSSASSSLNFFRAGGGCVNTAYSTVIAHEFGHFIVNSLGLAQGGFGEGFGDSVALLAYDTPVTGAQFDATGAIRSYDPAVPRYVQENYPCSDSAVHNCGQQLAGMWWEVRKNFGAKYAPSGDGLDRTRALFGAWSQITGGGLGVNSAHPQTAIEVLTVNDNDGILGNGTPDYAEICNAFSFIAVTCPALSNLEFQYPSGRPEFANPNAATTFPLIVAPLLKDPQPGTAQLFYRVGTSGAFTPASLSETSPNQYTVSIPAQACGSGIQYYVTASATDSTLVLNPQAAPAETYSAVSGTGNATIVSDTFSTNTGWTVSPTDTATTGRWARMVSQSTAAQPAGDRTSASGICWVTDGNAGASLGANDVDNGTTTLISPTIDASTGVGQRVSYYRWYSNSAGGNPGVQRFVVDISNNNGSTWTRLETVGPTGAEVAGGWRFASFRIADFVTPTAQMKFRFIAEDTAALPSLIEAAIDDFQVTAVTCPAVSPSCNPADLTGPGATYANGTVDVAPDGQLSIEDFVTFIAAFSDASGCPGTGPCNPADITGQGGTYTNGTIDVAPDGDLSVEDFIAFLAAFSDATGC